jgi:hypothetical protein
MGNPTGRRKDPWFRGDRIGDRPQRFGVSR